ncbi:transposase [Filibacter limicola]|uniref:Transposase n=1 Tax=Sporosarcina limicola TaxID=34101 RepID=A0A927RGE0_9BACL|nr:transposase [Sporosarcina limicola]
MDLGLKVPAAVIIDDDKARFFGNWRLNNYMKRKFRSIRKKLGKQNKVNAIRQLDDKEQRWMQNQDHKVSREIVDFATANTISVIRLEQLTIKVTSHANYRYFLKSARLKPNHNKPNFLVFFSYEYGIINI